jgi:hypothetical protein
MANHLFAVSSQERGRERKRERERERERERKRTNQLYLAFLEGHNPIMEPHLYDLFEI